MLNEFKNWLLNRNYKPSTALDYQGRIVRLCRKEAIILLKCCKDLYVSCVFICSGNCIVIKCVG